MNDDLREEFARLSRDSPPVRLQVDTVIQAARRVRRRRQSLAVTLTGGAAAAVLVLTALVLPAGTEGPDTTPGSGPSTDPLPQEPSEPDAADPSREDPPTGASPDEEPTVRFEDTQVRPSSIDHPDHLPSVITPGMVVLPTASSR